MYSSTEQRAVSPTIDSRGIGNDARDHAFIALLWRVERALHEVDYWLLIGL